MFKTRSALNHPVRTINQRARNVDVFSGRLGPKMKVIYLAAKRVPVTRKLDLLMFYPYLIYAMINESVDAVNRVCPDNTRARHGYNRRTTLKSGKCRASDWGRVLQQVQMKGFIFHFISIISFPFPLTLCLFFSFMLAIKTSNPLVESYKPNNRRSAPSNPRDDKKQREEQFVSWKSAIFHSAAYQQQNGECRLK